MAAALVPAQSLTDHIAAAIRERIASGEFALGSRVSDRDIAEALEVSRTPVREALLRLQSEGLVVMRPQRGTFVFDATPEELAEICELRAILESGALVAGAERARPALVEALRTNVDAARAALRANDLDRCEALDTDFHETLVALGGNRLLAETYRRISDKVRALRTRLPRERQRFAQALEQHLRIVELVERGAASSAAAELAEHVRNVHRLLATEAAPARAPGSRGRKPAHGAR